MIRVFNVSEIIGTDVRSRSAADSIRHACMAECPPDVLDFGEVSFISRSFADELYTILQVFPATKIVGMCDAVKNMYDVVMKGRSTVRQRIPEDVVVRNFSNIKELSAFMRNKL